MIVFRIERLEEAASTNDVVRERAALGALEGLVVQARCQTGGRGRHGRVWQSPPGNLYASILLRPQGSPAAAATLSLVSGLALAETLAARGQDVRLKWPNDVLANDAKLAGILLEASSAGDRLDAVILGLGVNVRIAPQVTDRPAVSLRDLGLDLAPEALLDGFLARLGPLLAGWRRTGFAGLRTAWLDKALAIGGPIRLRLGGRQVEGRFVDVDDDGCLVIEEQPSGRLARYGAGELLWTP